MAYSSEIHYSSERKLYKQRMDAVEELSKRKEFFYSRFPRARFIERELASTALQAAKAVINGANSRKELENLKTKNLKLQEELKYLLTNVNLPPDYLDMKYKCGKCKDEGYIDGIMCECLKEMMKKEAYERLNKMSPLSLCTFESFMIDYYHDSPLSAGEQPPRQRMASVLEFCKKYARDFNRYSPSLFMNGSAGLGKTHLSLAIANDVISKGHGVIYGSTQNMITQLEKERFKSGSNENETERHFIDCDLLIIDDLGTEFLTSFSLAAIYNIINSRILMGKPTIISTNLSMRELEKCYTERMVSRIKGNNIILEFLGDDIRQKRLKEMIRNR